jgi:hypothetical protein
MYITTKFDADVSDLLHPQMSIPTRRTKRDVSAHLSFFIRMYLIHCDVSAVFVPPILPHRTSWMKTQYIYTGEHATKFDVSNIMACTIISTLSLK